MILYLLFEIAWYTILSFDWNLIFSLMARFSFFSWLLQDEKMAVRTTYPPFMAATDRFFGALLPLVADLQFTRNGPIIAVQIENEYGAYGRDRAYMDGMGELLKKHGIRELLFTSDGPADLDAGQASNGEISIG